MKTTLTVLLLLSLSGVCRGATIHAATSPPGVVMVMQLNTPMAIESEGDWIETYCDGDWAGNTVKTQVPYYTVAGQVCFPTWARSESLPNKPSVGTASTLNVFVRAAATAPGPIRVHVRKCNKSGCGEEHTTEYFQGTAGVYDTCSVGLVDFTELQMGVASPIVTNNESSSNCRLSLTPSSTDASGYPVLTNGTNVLRYTINGATANGNKFTADANKQLTLSPVNERVEAGKYDGTLTVTLSFP